MNTPTTLPARVALTTANDAPAVRIDVHGHAVTLPLHDARQLADNITRMVEQADGTAAALSRMLDALHVLETGGSLDNYMREFDAACQSITRS